MGSPELEELAMEAQRGGRREREALLRAARPIVCRWAIVWTGSPDISEDVAQEVLVRVNRSLADFTPDASFSTWLYRITRNALVDEARRNGRDRTAKDAVRLQSLAETSAPSADRDLEFASASALLRRMMNDLSPQQRAAFDLVDLQGFAATEAAEMLDIAAATLRVHLFRARQTLRALGRAEMPTDHGS